MCEFIQGCMRIKDLSVAQIRALIDADLEYGINIFDHADIYGAGECEIAFGKALREDSSLRDKIVLQTKCGIVKDLSCHRYDNSTNYIVDSVHKSLNRLRVEKIDRLLVHRPDALMNPEEVAKAFDKLYTEGLVERFGVSNFSASQIELLSRSKCKIEFNQIRMSIAHCPMIEYGMNYNRFNKAGENRDGGTLDYCRLNDVDVQCYSPFKGRKKSFIGDNVAYYKLNKLLKELAYKYGVQPNAIAAAWLFRHPAGVSAVIGTTKPERVAQIAAAKDIVLTRAEWYDLYRACGRKLP